jgi:hypothetical protein
MDDLISRAHALKVVQDHFNTYGFDGYNDAQTVMDRIRKLPSAESEMWEYHYDHTDCIWYRPEARNRCPVTCAQYRDGWNDAMTYIFRDGDGYRPFRRDKKYEGRFNQQTGGD